MMAIRILNERGDIMRQFILKYFLTFFPPARLSTAVAAGLLAITSIAFAALEYTPYAGGSNGTSYTLSCGANGALVGIKGKAGSFVDRVQGICAQINYDGSWQGSTWTTNAAGGPGGTSYSLICPTGHAVRELVGRAGSYIDHLGVTCGKLVEDGKLYGGYTNTGSSVGGLGGKDPYTLICPNSKPAQLIRGRASTWVDSISLGCDTVNTQRVSYIVPTGYTLTAAVGSTHLAPVHMTLPLTATATVGFTSSNTNVATVYPIAELSTGTQEGRVSITPRAPGCTNITALYKGSSASSYLLVNSASSPNLSLTTPATIWTGSQPTITVTIPSPAPAGGTTITLTNLGPGTLSMPASIVIPARAVSTGFQVSTVKTLSLQNCARIKATGNGGDVTHTILLLQGS
jgi:hypothetical protein